jgi:uncharacterized protein YndB with AHSA1/START domain
MIKGVIIFISSIIGLILIIGAILPKSYTVKREIIINKPIDEVFSYIQLLKNQDNYSAWKFKKDLDQSQFKGVDGTVGFISFWDIKTNQGGKGAQEIKKIIENKRIEFELRFERPTKSTSNLYFETQSISQNSTKVIWGFEGKMAYPVNILLLFMNFETQIGNDFNEGLKNLKTILEK